MSLSDKNITRESSARYSYKNLIKYFLCGTFLISSFIFFNLVNSDLKWLFTILLFVPNYLCGEWLAEKIFHENSSLSIQNSGFSIKRILIATLILLTILLLVIYITKL